MLLVRGEMCVSLVVSGLLECAFNSYGRHDITAIDLQLYEIFNIMRVLFFWDTVYLSRRDVCVPM